ncbi:hypothetical protein FJZ18_01785 [Candidatus Pacearchaeota archaeon]|nr:hypothetical protein [Candidatus Pacearchaeota archaeon]
MNEVINHLLISALFGVLGAVLRVIVTVKKMQGSGRSFERGAFLVYFLCALVIGAFSGIILDFGRTGSFLAGYAGVDLMKGYATAFKRTKIQVKR